MDVFIDGYLGQPQNIDTLDNLVPLNAIPISFEKRIGGNVGEVDGDSLVLQYKGLALYKNGEVLQSGDDSVPGKRGGDGYRDD